MKRMEAEKVSAVRTQTLQSKKRHCECKYNVRWFNSKQAFLVLVWVVLYVLAMSSFIRIAEIVSFIVYYPAWVPVLCMVLSVPVSYRMVDICEVWSL